MNHRPLGFITQHLTRWAPPGVPSRCVSVRVISLVAILAVGLLLLTLLPRSATPSQQQPSFVLPATEEKSPVVDVASLIQAIQNATKHALQGRPEPTFDAAARELWYQKNPCRSREQLEPLYSLRRFVKDVKPNLRWKQVFREYETLHRVCTQNVGSGKMSAYFLSRSNSSGCRFMVGGIPPRAGLGNKVLAMISGLLYAILTQRVFLVPAETLVPGIMCEPFEGSSWLLDPEKKFTPEYEPGKQKFWATSAEFYRDIDNARSGKSSAEVSSSIYALSPNNLWCQPGARFFCDTEQAYLGRIPWLYVNGCLYYLPKLFAIPSLRPVLEELFPDRMALTHLLRSSMLPSDEVWRRIDQIYGVYMKDADRRVGIQVRYRDGEAEFNRTHSLVRERVLKCALDNGILPPAGGAIPAAGKASAPRPAPAAPNNQTRVFIASLFPSLHDFLLDMYVRNPPALEDIGIIQVTHGNLQHFNDEEDKQALAEIITLSFADYLFVTPLSTFGGLAQGYGALTPWFIDNRPKSDTACIRAQTADTCYQNPGFKFSCPYEPHLNGQWVLATVPYLKDCLAVDAKYGIQLITTQF